MSNSTLVNHVINHPLVRAAFKLDVNHIHGTAHWRRVEQLGQYLAKRNGADATVLSLFAYLHDARRETDHHDRDHGKRSAKLVEELYNAGDLELSEEQYEQLRFACAEHNSRSAQSDDVTVQTCWDSDRLDLWRIGVIPNPEYLYTAEAKLPATIEYASRLVNQ
jgi:uncharacterized protein